jgi:hypothetical protein
MPGPSKTTHEKDREEDYRDFGQRDLGEGWPYADGEPIKKRNAAYGETSDELDPTNMQVADQPFIDSEGGPSLFPDEENGSIDDDGIEERITERLSETERWSDNQLEVTVRRGIAEINGEVDTASESSLIERIVLGTSGVRDATNNLVLLGADSHIPSDADD